MSTERFDDVTDTGSDKNDFQTISTRLFLKGEGLGNSNWETITDLRDKHDFFDKLNREKLQLDERNQFQVRQLSARVSNPNQFFGFQVGRFPVYEVGSTFVDGLQIENHWTPSLYSTYFGGLNPQKRERSYLQMDEKAQVYGASLTYQSRNSGWNRNLYASHGVVSEIYDTHTDRNFIFQNLIYQWDVDSRIFSILYYDLVPRSYVQNGTLTWQQGWSRYFVSDLSHTALDVIEYSRNQELLEQLPSSPYNESRVKLTYRIQDLSNRLYLLFTSGKREVDNLTRETAEMGYIRSQIWGPHWDAYFVIGTRDNFTSKDTLARLGLGRYGRKWEFNLDLEGQEQKNVSGVTTHPLLAEISATYYISRRSFWTLSGQSASDEKVNIMSGFFRYGYRFGNRELPPLRDGAPPRGPL